MDWFDTNGDGFYDTGYADLNGDGVYDTVQLDANFDGYVDGYLWDVNFDGVVDTVQTDANEDGIVDATGWDVDQDGDVDYYADASTGWNVVAAPNDGANIWEIGPAWGSSEIETIQNIPGADWYNRMKLDGVVWGIEWSSAINASPAR